MPLKSYLNEFIPWLTENLPENIEQLDITEISGKFRIVTRFFELIYTLK